MKTRSRRLGVAVIAVLAGIVGGALVFQGGEVADQGNGVAQDPLDAQTTPGRLGENECISIFKVERADPPNEPLSGPEQLGYFQSFSSGAFFGKIEDYQPSQAAGFSSLIDGLMKDGEIRTYEHLSAEVCLYSEDLLNPEGGATLRYFVEHTYCTNECRTGTYSIRVDLKSDGHFVGYREESKW